MHYFDVGAIWARYPGVRCDGLHFASEFVDFAAYGEEQRQKQLTSAATVAAAPRLETIKPDNSMTDGTAAQRLPEEDDGGGMSTPPPPLRQEHPKGGLDCNRSSGVYDYHLLRALEHAGLLECVGRWVWEVRHQES